MIKKIFQYVIPHLVGLGLILMGWFIPLVNVKMSNFNWNQYSLFNNWTVSGLVIILIGAYLPEIWIRIIRLIEKGKEKKNKTDEPKPQ